VPEDATHPESYPVSRFAVQLGMAGVFDASTRWHDQLWGAINAGNGIAENNGRCAVAGYAVELRVPEGFTVKANVEPVEVAAITDADIVTMLLGMLRGGKV